MGSVGVLLPYLCGPPTHEQQEAHAALRSMPPAESIPQLIHIFVDGSAPQPIRGMAIIMVSQILGPRLLPSAPPELLRDILNATCGVFSSDSPMLASLSGSLFAQIAIHDLHGENNFNVLDTLLPILRNPPSPSVFFSVCVVLRDLLGATLLLGDAPEEVLSLVVGHLGGNLGKVPRDALLGVLGSMLDNIGEVLVDAENAEGLLSMLAQLVIGSDSRAAAFDVWSAFVINYFPLLENHLGPMLVAALAAPPDRECALAAFVLWLNVAGAEASADVPFRAIPPLLPVGIETLAMHSAVDVEECDQDATWEPHVAAGKALQSVVGAYPEESLPLILGLVGRLGVCEASLNLANFAIQFCQFEPHMDGFLGLVAAGLVDPRCRIRDVALFCVHALVRALSSPLETVGEWIMQVADRVIELVGDAMVGRTAALVLGDLLTLPSFPKIGAALATLFGAVCTLGVDVAEAASSVLVSTMDELSQRMRAGILALGVHRLRQTKRFELIAVVQRALVDVEVGSMLPDVWAALEGTGEEPRDLIVAFAALARSAGAGFGPRLGELLDMIVRVAQEPFDSSVGAAAAAVSLISDVFDLSPVAADLIVGFRPCAGGDLGVRRFVLEALGDLVRFAPAMALDVAAVAQEAAEALPDLDLDDDDGEVEPLEMACVRCALAALACAAAAGESLAAVLAVMGGMKELDDSVLSICIDAIVELGKVAPELVCNSPSVEAIVRAAAAAEVSPEVTARVAEALQIVFEAEED